MVADRLELEGYRVISLADPNDTIPTLLCEDCRVVLLDVEMPGINGLTVLHQIKEFDGGIQVIMLTGLDTLSTLLETMRGGAEACFFKPLQDYTELYEAIARAFQKIDGWHHSVQDFSARQSSLLPRTQPLPKPRILPT
jgi:DNA-binding NtrC family response regulator